MPIHTSDCLYSYETTGTYETIGTYTSLNPYISSCNEDSLRRALEFFNNCSYYTDNVQHIKEETMKERKKKRFSLCNI